MRRTFPNTRVLLIAAFDDVMHAHAGLRRRALERLGCQVTAFNLLSSGGLLGRLRGGSLGDRLARAIAQAQPTVVLVFEGAQLSAATVAALKRTTDALWVNWFCDGRRRRPQIEDLAGPYDQIFVPGSDLAQRLDVPGRPPVAYLPAGCDPSVHRPMRSRDQFRANVVFAGTATPYRERLLSELVEFGLAVWGPGWRRTKLRDYCRGELLRHSDYVRAYAGASVAVSVPFNEPAAGGDCGCSRRLFELAAIGVPQVTHECPDLARHFREGAEVHVYRDPTELRGLTSEVLMDRRWAEPIAAAGRQRAISEHTYVHRLAALLEEVVPETVRAEVLERRGVV